MFAVFQSLRSFNHFEALLLLVCLLSASASTKNLHLHETGGG